MIAGDTLEGVAFERALVGWTEPVYFRGQKCGERRRYDDALLMFWLKALKPETYGNKVRIPARAAAAPPAQPKVEVVFRNAAEDDSARKSSSVERQESFFHSTVEPENSISTAASMTPEVASAVGEDFPKSDQEIIALTRRFLKSADATAPYLSNGRDHSGVVVLPPERLYSKSPWT
jgi:hypothetical protein